MKKKQKRTSLVAERMDMDLGNYLAPLPVTLISTRREGESANVCTVAWNGIVNSKPPMVSISLRKERYSHESIMQSKEFVINLVGKSLAKAVDYCGVKSFRDEDKVATLGLEMEGMPELKTALALADAPLSLGCKVQDVISLPSHDLFIAEVLSVRIQKDLLDGRKALRLDRADLLSYVHGQYYELGRWLGFFGWSIADKKRFAKRKHAWFKHAKPKGS